MKKDLVIVESPAKAKTISSYLGGKMEVLASYGHIRDLASKEGVVEPSKDFKMHWSYNDRGVKQMKKIAASAKYADRLYLATDPDREGEAIAWHVLEALKEKKISPPQVRRVIFHEITPRAVAESFERPTQINPAMVEAYLARRALDYLFGFTLSPILWRRLPGSRSVGRVQSAAVRLIAEREEERLSFKSVPYWLLQASVRNAKGEFKAVLSEVGGQKAGKFYFKNRVSAEELENKLRQLKTLRVVKIVEKQQRQNPPPPFTTSTLQQAASNRLGFSAARTMRVAQSLYEGFGEGGLITYMRTDSVAMAKPALAACRRTIAARVGAKFVPDTPNFYKNKVKNAQEAHEAIRPTDFSRLPSFVPGGKDEANLYELIWQRAMASQTASAVIGQTAVDMQAGEAVFRANGSVIIFEGFLRFYPRRKTDEGEQTLPPLGEGEEFPAEYRVSDHETKPPPRYNEASLVKTLEEKGIGRPSTYAAIISTVQERGYARLEKRQFVPSGLGMMAAAFFRRFFKTYVDYDFTAQMEEQLDGISNGKKARLELLGDFWLGLQKVLERTQGISIRQVIENLEEECEGIIFPAVEGQTRDQARVCPRCSGRLNLKLSRNGPFIGCSAYPGCNYTAPLFAPPGAEPVPLGDGITLRQGPYGFYLQRESGHGKPKRVSLPKNVDSSAVDAATAAAYMELPRKVGDHPEGGEITAGVGMYGAYVRHDKTYASLGGEDDVLTVGINRAVVLLAEKRAKAGKFASAEPIKVLTADGEKEGRAELKVFEGRYGPYIQLKQKGKKAVNASIPKGVEAKSLGYEQAAALIAKRQESLAKKAKKPQPGAAKAKSN